MSEAVETKENVSGAAKVSLTRLQLHGLTALALAGVMALQSLLPRLSIAGLVYAALFAIAGLAVFFQKRRKRGGDDLKLVVVDDAGLKGMNFGSKRLDFAWSEMSLVRFNSAESTGTGSVEVEGRGLRAVIRQDSFLNFALIRDTLRRRCEEKRVKCEDRDIEPKHEPSKIEAAKIIIEGRASYDPRKVFSIVMLVMYLVAFFIMLASWGAVAGWVFITIIWILLGAGWIYVPGLLPLKWLKSVHITEVGLWGKSFDGKKTEMSWEDVHNVAIRFPEGSGSGAGQSGKIIVHGKGKAFKIGHQFPAFGPIAIQISRICGEKNIRLISTGLALTLHERGESGKVGLDA